jgi:erythromycin esterase
MDDGARSGGLSWHVVLLAATCGVLAACGGGDSVSTPPTQNPPPQESEPTAFEVRLSELNEALHPIESTDPMSSLTDLEPLSRLAQARVVGMGEATHGTREFFHLRHKILRWLVEEHGMTVFAIESSVSEGVYLDRYVQSGEGDLEAIMLEHMQYWAWYTEEMRDLIQWMADYNAANPEVPLRYFGVDCGPLGQQSDLIIEYLAEAAPELVGDAEVAVGQHRSGAGEAYNRYQEMSPEEHESIHAELAFFRSLLIDEKPALVNGSSLAEFRLALYLLDNLVAGHQYYFNLFNEESSEARAIFRDRCMADNVIRLEELLEEGVRVAYWGHNFHIAASMFEDRIPFAGHNLRQDLGSDYRAIGFSFSHGELIAMGNTGLVVHEVTLPPREGSVAELFHAASENRFLLDLGALPASELLDWLREPQYTRTVGSVVPDPLPLYWQERLAERYDAIIHIDESTATAPLPVP